MSQDLRNALPELQAIILASTYAHPEAWAEHMRRTLAASNNRSVAATATNQARTRAEHAALDDAVLQVRGAVRPSFHGAPKVIQDRIATAVWRGALSSTCGGTNLPSVRAIRHSLDRIEEKHCSPLMGEHPAAFSSSYSSVSPSTGHTRRQETNECNRNQSH